MRRGERGGARRPGARGPVATIFLSDQTAEAGSIGQALRAEGHAAVDVPQAMLVARVAVQQPHVILVDADSEGALEVVARIRELPKADEIQVLFLARAGGAIATPEEAVAKEGNGLFVRPDRRGRRREQSRRADRRPSGPSRRCRAARGGPGFQDELGAGGAGRDARCRRQACAGAASKMPAIPLGSGPRRRAGFPQNDRSRAAGERRVARASQRGGAASPVASQ